MLKTSVPARSAMNLFSTYMGDHVEKAASGLEYQTKQSLESRNIMNCITKKLKVFIFRV